MPSSGFNLIHKIYGQGQSDAARKYEAREGGGGFVNSNFCRAKAHEHLGPNVHRYIRTVSHIQNEDQGQPLTGSSGPD